MVRFDQNYLAMIQSLSSYLMETGKGNFDVGLCWHIWREVLVSGEKFITPSLCVLAAWRARARGC